MTLGFPNQSRSFDQTRGAVRFSGHDGMFEVLFFVDTAALMPAGPVWQDAGKSEATCLSAFDAARSTIQDAARKAYAGKRQPFYRITANDLP